MHGFRQGFMAWIRPLIQAGLLPCQAAVCAILLSSRKIPVLRHRCALLDSLAWCLVVAGTSSHCPPTERMLGK